MKTYNFSNTYIHDECIIREFWNGYEIKSYNFTIPYDGKGFEAFINNNFDKIRTLTINLEAMRSIANGDELF